MNIIVRSELATYAKKVLLYFLNNHGITGIDLICNMTQPLWIPTHPGNGLLLEQVCSCTATQNLNYIRDSRTPPRYLPYILCS